MKNLKDKVVVITGAASGIGKALTEIFAKEGCHLALNDINETALQNVVDNINNNTSTRIISSIFDVSKVENFESFAKMVEEEFGRVDIVINNAGVALGRVTIEEVSYKDFEWVMGINFWGMVYGTKSFLPLLKKQKESAIINLSSLFGIAGIGHQGAYCSSKFAIRGFTESLRMEAKLEFPQVVIHTVHPGGIKTNIAKNARWVGLESAKTTKEETIKSFEKLFITTPEDAAKKIIKCIRKKRSRIIIGKDARQLDWLVRLMPERYTDLVLKQLKKDLDI